MNVDLVLDKFIRISNTLPASAKEPLITLGKLAEIYPFPVLSKAQDWKLKQLKSSIEQKINQTQQEEKQC